MTFKHVLLVSAMVSALTGAAQANTLLNPNFDSPLPGGPPPITVGTATNLGGWSAAEHWSTWARVPGGTVWTELVGNDHGRRGNMLHVVVHGGSGIVQAFLAPDTGPRVASACAWVKVVSGRAGIGLGNGGDTGIDAHSTGTGVWEWLSAANGVSPANEFIVYADSADAEFYVDRAVVSENPNECPTNGVPVKWARPETYVKPDPFPWTQHPEQGNGGPPAYSGDPSQQRASPNGYYENMAPKGGNSGPSPNGYFENMAPAKSNAACNAPANGLGWKTGEHEGGHDHGSGKDPCAPAQNAVPAKKQ